jgi:acyl dehydratase
MTKVIISKLPHPLSLYFKCGQTLLKGSENLKRLPTLTRKGVAYNNVSFDNTTVRKYSECCDFKFHDNNIPLFYPCLIFFPRQLNLMVDPQFPFPVVGLVHLSNKMTMHRPISTDESNFTAIVRFSDGFAKHDKGVCFSIHSELYDAKDSLCWSSESKYLKKINAKDIVGVPSSYQSEIKENQVSGLQELKRWAVPQSAANEYAHISGDYNPIHISGIGAKLFGFSSPIIHGMWTAGKSVAALISRFEDPSHSAQLSSVFLEFKTPLYTSSTAILSASSYCPEGVVFEVKGQKNTVEEAVPCLRGRVNWKL